MVPTDTEDAGVEEVVAALDEIAVVGLPGVVSFEIKWPVDGAEADERLLEWLEDLDNGACDDCWVEADARLLVCDEGCCKDEMDVVVIVGYEEVEEEFDLV